MFQWSAFPFIRVSICVMLGIVLFDSRPELWVGAEVVLVFFLGAYLLCWLFFRNTILFGLASLSLLGYLGGLLVSFRDASRQQDHYAKYEWVDGFTATIVSDHSERTNHYRFEAELHQVALAGDSLVPVTGKIYLYVKKPADTILSYGDVVVVTRGYFGISGPKNPHEFDYQEYLRKQNIYAHAFVEENELVLIGSYPPNPLRKFAYEIRTAARAQLDEFIPYERERGILVALLLGIKDHLDADLKEAYAAAGAMHVLAVSGLHVGIVYYILLVLMRGLKEKRWGRPVFVLVSLSLIWIYALVTGFSPSVMRATTMFSVIIISDAVKRRANIYNSLGVAAFLLILYDPYMIYAVGFQLSFAAVFGIVVLHRPLYKLFDFRYKVPDYFWSITCVSIAAQVATFPLTLLYFHQFPTYFLISNLVVIPAATVMLGLGIVMLFVGALYPLLGQWIGLGLQGVVWLANELISAIKLFPYPIFDWLYFDPLDTILVYLIMTFLAVGLIRYRFSNLVMAGVLLVWFLGGLHWKEWQQRKQQRLVIYELDEAVGIDLIDGPEALLLVEGYTPESSEVIDYQVNPNRLASGLSKAASRMAQLDTVQMVRSASGIRAMEWKGIKLLIVDQLERNTIEAPLQADVIYLKRPVSIEPAYLKGVVVLGTGFNFYQTRDYLNTFREAGISAHSLTQDGYWSMDLSRNESK